MVRTNVMMHGFCQNTCKNMRVSKESLDSIKLYIKDQFLKKDTLYANILELAFLEPD